MARLLRRRLLVRPLEARDVPAIVTVTNNLDGAVTGANQLPGSLRQAIFDCNADSAADTITITNLGAPLILTAGALKVTSKNIVINGPGSTLQTISGNSSSRILEFNDKSQASNAAVSITGLTLTNGKVTGSNVGGGILADNEHITLTDVTVSNCSTSYSGGVNIAGYGGGGIYVSGLNAKLTLNNCTVTGNTTTDSTFFNYTYGGGVYFYGATLSANSTTFSNNVSSGGPDSPYAAAGGAVNFGGDTINATATFTGCTIINNTAGRGGGLFSKSLYGAGMGMAVTLTSCTVSGNKAQGGTQGTYGGGGAYLYNIGKLTVSSSVITGNQIIGKTNGTDYAQGAGLRVYLHNSGNMTPGKFGVNISNSTISNNISSGGGGGLALAQSVSLVNLATVLISGSIVENNQANGKTGGILGGGLSFARVGVNATIENSQINHNFAYEGGGGIQIQGDTDTISMNYFPSFLTIRNSTVAYNSTGNSKAGRGAGIGAFSFDKSNSNTVSIQNSTIAFNKSAYVSGGTPDNSSGGLYVSAGTAALGASVKIESSIFYNNTYKNGATLSDIFSPIKGIDVSNSLISVTNSPATIVFKSDVGNIKGTLAAPANPIIDTVLSFNGATTTKTLALLAGSPCFNTGANPLGLTTDQRGIGFARNAQGDVDMGAFEIQPAASPPQINVIQIENGATQRSLIRTIHVTFSEAVMFPAGIAAAFDVSRYDKGPSGSVSLTLNQVGADVTISFTTGGGIGVDPGNSLQDGKYRLTIHADKVQGVGGFLDGNKSGTYDGVPADNLVQNFHRLFGDSNGDGGVTALDFAQFRAIFGLSGPSIFDFNNDNVTNALDFAQFRARFGLSGYV